MTTIRNEQQQSLWRRTASSTSLSLSPASSPSSSLRSFDGSFEDDHDEEKFLFISPSSSFDTDTSSGGSTSNLSKAVISSRRSKLPSLLRPVCVSVVLVLTVSHLLLLPQRTEISLYEERQPEARRAPRLLSDRHAFSSSSYNYTFFWETAWEKAQASLASAPQSHDTATQPCPKVYVYNLSDAFSDSDPTNTSLSKVFGKSHPGTQGHLRDTIQHHVGVIFEHRLQQPGNCYRTDDPTEADLFFVPLLLHRKKASIWKSVCQSLNATALLDELVHLSPETACQHFFVFPKGHYSGEHCQGWFFDPLPELQNAMRLAYSHTPGTADDEELMYFRKASPDPEQARKRHPNLMSIPYPSSLHWHGTRYRQLQVASNHSQDAADGNNATAEDVNVTITNFTMPTEQRIQQDRPFLMSYVGRFDHGDVPVRSRIQQQCKAMDDPTKCHLPDSDIERRSSLPSQEILVKGQSIFCLEPAGDSPWRKGLADSITFGCIPVLFSDLSDDITPWHWDHWKHRGRVLIDREAFVAGDIDLYELLSSSISQELLSLMQETIRTNARQYQYSLSDDSQDAFHLALTKMKQLSSDRISQGQCGTVGVM